MSNRPSELGRVVRERRERLGLRQEEVADLAACSTRFVHTVENGKETARLDKLLDVLTVLGLELRVRRGSGGITVEDGHDGPARRRDPAPRRAASPRMTRETRHPADAY